MNEPILHSTPVALLIFNRPGTTQRVFDAVARARPRRLLVVADGPRPDRPGEEALCRHTRAVIENVDWPCEVETKYSERNLGCRMRIASGLDWVFSRVDEAIILEDDCLPDPSFFPYCEELLGRYRNDERIHMIRGGNFLEGRRVASTSYYFSMWYHIWGWATWARAWKHTDMSMRHWPTLKEDGWLERMLRHDGMVSRAREIFDSNYAGQLDTWEYNFVFGGWQNNALAIAPVDNMVTNIGFGADATHLTQENHPHSRLALRSVRFPLRHPRAIEVLSGADRTEWELVNPHLVRRTLLRRVRSRLRREFARMFPGK